MELPACFLCPVCLHGFDAQPPLIAPCGHAACIRCVKNLVECPVCRAPPDRWWRCSNLQEGAIQYVKMLMQHSRVPEGPDPSKTLAEVPRLLPDEVKIERAPRIFAKLDEAPPPPDVNGASARAFAENIIEPRGVDIETLSVVTKFLQAAVKELCNAPGQQMECRMLAETANVTACWPAHVPRKSAELARLMSFLRDVFALRVTNNALEEGIVVVCLCNKTPEQQNVIANFLDTEHPLQEVFLGKLDEALHEATWQRHRDGSFSTLCRGDLYNLSVALLEKSETKQLLLREIRNELDLGVGLNELYSLLKELRFSFLVRHQGQLFGSMETLETSLGLQFGIDISRGLSRNPVCVYVLAPSVAGIWGERITQ